MTGLAVVGTDTGVGKTVVTAGVVSWLRERGVDARAVKPCQTGHPPDDDAGVVADACGDPDAATCARYLEPPLAPAVAARETGAHLDYGAILAACRETVADSEVGVVEGIGGLRVPLADGREVVDLVADLGVPALVVARSGLGTLNHTALTVEALEGRGVTVSGIVLNEYTGEGVAERTNPGVIEGMTGHDVVTVPPAGSDDPTALAGTVATAIEPSVLPSGLPRQ